MSQIVIAATSFDALIERVVAWLPSLVLVLGVVLAGLIMASIARRATCWVVDKSGLEALMERLGVSRILYAAGARKGAAQAFGLLVYTAIVLLMLAIVAEILGLPGVAEGVAVIVAFLPRVLGAIAIVLCGLFLADLLRTVVRRMARDDDELDSPDLVAQLVYYLVVIVAVTMSVEQVGLKTGLLNSLIQIGLGAAALSAGIAFAFGSREIFKSVMARYYMERLVAPGDEVILEDGRAGIVEGFSPTSIVVHVETETVLIPCRVLVERPIHIRRLPTPKSQPED
ncbi:MAG: hypothetical protein ACI9OJ_001722 [Myxococcota bacterium]|jgi:hypothetical protein